MIHLEYSEARVRPVETTILRRVMNTLLRSKAPYQVIDREDVFALVTTGQVHTLNRNGQHLFYRNEDGTLQKVDVEGNQVVRRILHLDEITFVEENEV